MIAAILALGLVGPRWPGWAQAIGAALVPAGLALGVWAGRTLGSSLTPFPRPRYRGELVEDGPYRYVRHPIYTGGLGLFVGYGLVTSIAATVATVALGALWWGKSTVEERHLAARFPGYGDYRRRVPGRLLPFL